MSLKIKVAFCTQCKGYRSSTPEGKISVNHPEFIDHFFYHGEPWVTLDSDTFEKCSSDENVDVRTVTLEKHAENDKMYCHCQKENSVLKLIYPGYEAKEIIERFEVETDPYFKDLYYTARNFHGLHSLHGKNNGLGITG